MFWKGPSLSFFAAGGGAAFASSAARSGGCDAGNASRDTTRTERAIVMDFFSSRTVRGLFPGRRPRDKLPDRGLESPWHTCGMKLAAPALLLCLALAAAGVSPP